MIGDAYRSRTRAFWRRISSASFDCVDSQARERGFLFYSGRTDQCTFECNSERKVIVSFK